VLTREWKKVNLNNRADQRYPTNEVRSHLDWLQHSNLAKILMWMGFVIAS